MHPFLMCAGDLTANVIMDMTFHVIPHLFPLREIRSFRTSGENAHLQPLRHVGVAQAYGASK